MDDLIARIRDHGSRLAVATLLVAVPCVVGTIAVAQPAADPSAVASLFAERCTLCHAGGGAPVGLRLDDVDAALRGGERGPVIVPGDPEGSELIARLRGTSQPRMPLTGPPFLSDDEIAMVSDWIAAGAPTSAVPAPDAAAPAADAEDEAGAVDEAAAAGVADDASEATSAAPGSFADVAPLFAARCAYCHMPNGAMGAPPEGLVLSSHDAIVASGERAVVVAGAPLASELYRRVAGLSTPRMPFDGPPWLDEATVQRIRAWIEAGAPGPDGTAIAVPVGAEVRLGGTLGDRWALDGLPLEVTTGTRIDDGPRAGDRVEVRGVVTADGGVRATRIRTR